MTQKAEIEVAKENEQEKQIVENGKRLLNLVIINSDSKEKEDTQL